ncbi:MAG: ComF family protein [Desulfotignum sp.]|nr:ComF family protein [Desulfotignum sp.]
MFQVFTDRGRQPVRECLKTTAKTIEALVFPDQCLSCRALLPHSRKTDVSDQIFFCAACRARGIPEFNPPFCQQCGQVFDTGDIHFCETCLTDPPDIHRVRAALVYQGLVPDILALFKYHARLSLTRFFDTLMVTAFDRYFSDTDIHLIVPVPLHSRKLRQRGFNQSALLVRRFDDRYLAQYGTPPGWQVDTTVLKRVRHTVSQTGLDTDSRKTNLKNAFQVTDDTRIQGANILLVDDVFTTGATCGEAAKTLVAAGAEQVDVLVLARA